MPQRRTLKFTTWDEVIADINALSGGYSQAGKWNLEQTLLHLDDWLGFPMDGFPPAPLLVRAMMGVVRKLAGARMLRTILSQGKMKDGIPTASNTVHAAGATDNSAAAVAKTLATIDRFRNHTGPIQTSPIFGDMDKETAQQLQFIHFAHHLSWLEAAPKQQ